MSTSTPLVKIFMSQSSSPIKYVVFSFNTSAITSSETLTMFTMKINSKVYKLKFQKGTNTLTDKNNNKIKIYQTVDGSDTLETDVLFYHKDFPTPVGSFEYKAGMWTYVAIKFPPSPSSASFKDSYIQVNSNTACSLTMGHFAYYANTNNELKEYFRYNYWDDINNSNWYNIKQNNTWQTVYYSLINAKIIDNIQTLFNTFAGNNVINQTSVVYDETDSRMLTITNPEFRIYLDISKKLISKIPA